MIEDAFMVGWCMVEDAFMVGGMNGLKMFLWFDVAELGLLHFLHLKKRHASQSKWSFDTILSSNATGDKHFTVNSDRLSQQLTRVPSSDCRNSWRVCPALIVATADTCAQLWLSQQLTRVPSFGFLRKHLRVAHLEESVYNRGAVLSLLWSVISCYYCTLSPWVWCPTNRGAVLSLLWSAAIKCYITVFVERMFFLFFYQKKD